MDEDTLTIPAPWRRRLHPRRGGTPGTPVTIDPAAAGALRARLDAHAADIADLLGHPGSDPGLVAAAHRYLRGEDDPLGASVAGQIAIHRDHYGTSPHTGLVDAWCAAHGPAFAAEAVAGFGRAETTWRWIEMGHQKGTVSEAWVRHRDPHQQHCPWWPIKSTLRRMRSILAAADDTDYQRAAARLAACRDTTPLRHLTAYLLPTRQDWVDDCLTAAPTGPARTHDWMLWCCVRTAGQARALGDAHWITAHPDLATTAVEGLGAAIGPHLAHACATAHHAKARRNAADLLAILPTDEAFQALLDRAGTDRAPRPALAAAMRRFPARAARLLATAAAGTGPPATTAAGLLHEHLATHPALDAGEPAPGAPATERVPDAPLDALPPSLTDPPWKHRGARTTVIGGLAAPGGDAVRWDGGERERWASPGHRPPDPDWDRQITEYHAGRLTDWQAMALFTGGPDEAVRPLFAAWAATRPRPEGALKPLAARYELDALPMIADAAARDPARHGDTLLPFLTPRVAALMADWAARLPSARPLAHAWFARHRTAAAALLIPAALGPPGRARQAAEFALLHIAGQEGDTAVEDAARVHGAAAAAAVTALLATGPPGLGPIRVPRVGDWAGPALLPQVLLQDRRRALPAPAVRTLLTTLALPLPGGGRPDLSDVLDHCDRGSLAAFSWALYERWEAAGHPARDGWALTQLGLIGGDDAARRLAPLIRAWPGRSRHTNAATGLDVLAEIGTDVALTHLHGISQTPRYPALRRRAHEKIQQIADRLGLTRDELADRLVPDLGLDADGTLTLDYGPRRFTVGFDALLTPHVRDEHGRPRRTLPRPGAADDPERAPAAYRRFAALRKDVRAVAGTQVRRLETAMIERRTWPAADFQRLLADHPLLRHITRRLVWATGDDATFRIAEDGTFTGPADDTLDLPATATVRVAHPLDPPGALTAWAPVFADYEIAQPFAQLDRPVHALTPAERATGDLARHAGARVPLGRLLGLERRGWEHEHPADAGIVGGMSRHLPGGAAAHIGFEPAVAIGHRDPAEEVTVSVSLTGARTLGAVAASEILAELAAAIDP